MMAALPRSRIDIFAAMPPVIDYIYFAISSLYAIWLWSILPPITVRWSGITHGLF